MGLNYIFSCLFLLIFVIGLVFPSPHAEHKIRSIKIDGVASVNTNVTLIESGEWVTVEYEAAYTPDADSDVLYVFSPPSVDYSNHAAVKFKMASVDNNYLATGKGSTSFRLVNMREDYVILLAQGGDIVASSPIIKFKNYNEPTQAHLALTQDPSQIRLKWVSKNATNPEIRWGTISGNYPFLSRAATATYTSKDLCGSPANSVGWMDPGFIHDGLLTNLIPNQKYYYIYGDSSAGLSTEKSFVAPPAVGADSVNLIAFGDLGKGEVDGSSCHWDETPALSTTSNIAQELEETKYDAVFHIGDISYAVGYASQWDAFFDSIEPLASRVPWMVCPGNHEVDFYSNSWLPVGDSYGECGVPYFARFNMPRNNLPWYSFDLGPVHFVLMSTEHDFTQNSEQYRFLAVDLATVNRTKTPWVIFAGHRPMYISSTNFDKPDGDQTIATLLRQHVEPLLFKYQVDMAWWGHHHSYQRSCPVFNETCTAAATVHVVIGMAGMGLCDNIMPVAPRWAQYINDEEYGYTRLFVTRSTIHMQFFNEQRVLRDEFTLHVRV